MKLAYLVVLSPAAGWSLFRAKDEATFSGDLGDMGLKMVGVKDGLVYKAPALSESANDIIRKYTKNTIVEVAWVQDFSASQIDDLPNLRGQIPATFATLKGKFKDSRFGLVGFVDKPIEPHGSNSSADYCNRIKYPLTSNVDKIVKALSIAVVHSGRDWPESQLHAMLGTALNRTMKWSAYGDAKDGRKILKFMIVVTDAGFHVAGEADLPPNNGDGDEDCIGEDYPSIAQVSGALEKKGIIPIFLTVKDVAPVYRQLVKKLNNNGAVGVISSDSSNLEEAVLRAMSPYIGNPQSCVESPDCCYGKACCEDSPDCDSDSEVVIRIHHKPKRLQVFVSN